MEKKEIVEQIKHDLEYYKKELSLKENSSEHMRTFIHSKIEYIEFLLIVIVIGESYDHNDDKSVVGEKIK